MKTRELLQTNCGKCIKNGNRYCYVKTQSVSGDLITDVTTGHGKCCALDDFSSDGCDPIKIHEQKVEG